MIINIRGTSGSGKTYVVRALMEKFGDNLLVHSDGECLERGKVVAHCSHYLMQPVYFIGDYSGAECGGCDTIPTQNLVCSLVRHFSQFGHVVFEGLLISHLYARYASLGEELADVGEHIVFMYLDTPIELCLARVRERRARKGNTKPFNPANTIGKHESVHKCYVKMVEAGLDARWFHRYVDIMELLDEYPFSYSYKEQSFR